MEFKENWHTVVKALEKIIPHYEEVNRYLSLGYAEKARIYTINSPYIESNSLVLDAGIGPRSLSKIAPKAEVVTSEIAAKVIPFYGVYH